MNPQSCDEKAKLLADYHVALKRYTGAVDDLRLKMATSPKAEYQRLERAADEARVKSEHARLALEDHTAEHGC